MLVNLQCLSYWCKPYFCRWKCCFPVNATISLLITSPLDEASESVPVKIGITHTRDLYVLHVQTVFAFSTIPIDQIAKSVFVPCIVLVISLEVAPAYHQVCVPPCQPGHNSASSRM